MYHISIPKSSQIKSYIGLSSRIPVKDWERKKCGQQKYQRSSRPVDEKRSLKEAVGKTRKLNKLDKKKGKKMAAR